MCEALLLPVLAQREGYDLAKHHIAVIPLCGVAFETFKMLLGPSGLGVKASIVTDADPPVPKGANYSWKSAEPARDGSVFKLSARTEKLRQTFAGHETVKVVHSKLTLEYDLAEAGDANARYMAEAWEAGFDATPTTLNCASVDAAADREEKALTVWRGVCLSYSSGSKADLAHRLADMLAEKDAAESFVCKDFVTPVYLRQAISHVYPPVPVPAYSPVTSAPAVA